MAVLAAWSSLKSTKPKPALLPSLMTTVYGVGSALVASSLLVVQQSTNSLLNGAELLEALRQGLVIGGPCQVAVSISDSSSARFLELDSPDIDGSRPGGRGTRE